MFADFIKTGDPSPPGYDKWEPTDDRNNYFKIDFIGDERMPGNTNGYHAGAVQFWKKTAPKVDQFFSKWDVNGLSPFVSGQLYRSRSSFYFFISFSQMI